MNSPRRLAVIILAGLWALAAPGIWAGPGGPGGAGGGHGAGGFAGHGGHSGKALAGNGRAGRSIGHSFFHFLGRGSRQPVNPGVAAAPGSSMAFPAGFHSRPRGSATRFVVEAPVHFHHVKHFGFAGCPEFGLSRSLFWAGDVDCSSGGFYFDRFFGGYVPYDFPITGEGTLAPTDRSGGVVADDRPGDSAVAAKPRTLLALKDGSEFALTEYWLEGYALHYVTTYGGRNSVPVERVDLGRTVADNAARGVEFVLSPRPAGRSDHTVAP